MWLPPFFFGMRLFGTHWHEQLKKLCAQFSDWKIPASRFLQISNAPTGILLSIKYIISTRLLINTPRCCFAKKNKMHTEQWSSFIYSAKYLVPYCAILWKMDATFLTLKTYIPPHTHPHWYSNILKCHPMACEYCLIPRNGIQNSLVPPNGIRKF